MDCGHGWRNDADCDICRPPAIVVAGLRGRITDLEAALREIAARSESGLDDTRASGRSMLRMIVNKVRSLGIE